MPLNKVKSGSNMYSFLNDYPFKGANRGYTWNPIGGSCFHRCCYCYLNSMKERYPTLRNKYSGKPFLVERELKTNLGSDNYIFVGSLTDMFAKNVPDDVISKVIEYCNKFTGNKYLLQSKNPIRMMRYNIDNRTNILGTTIESNRDTGKYRMSKYAPSINRRIYGIYVLGTIGYETMITIEPIIDFDLEPLVKMIKFAKPDWVNIGADSKNCYLPEPDRGKVLQLIQALSEFTEIKQKNNLRRLLISSSHDEQRTYGDCHRGSRNGEKEEKINESD